MRIHRCWGSCWLSLLLLVLLANFSDNVVDSLPYFLLNSHQAKCFQMDVNRGTTVTIDYHAPDLVLQEEMDAANNPAESSKFDKQRMEDLKKMSKNLRDMNIMIMHRHEDLGSSWNPSKVAKMDTGGTGRLREQLETRRGSLEFLTGKLDGRLEICVQSLAARTLGASRIQLNIATSHTETEEDKAESLQWQEEEKAQMEADKRKNRTAVVQNGGRISSELHQLTRRIRELEDNAEHAKNQETEFQNKSVKLNKSVKYWPMFRMIVLIVGGYMQVGHVVKYMKSKHIY